MSTLSIGFKNFTQAPQHTSLKVTGTIPNWLTGRYVKVGMGQYQVGAERMQHWFDGYALACQFAFQQDHVECDVRFIESNHYKVSQKKNKIVYPEFATRGNMSCLARLLDFKNLLSTDNTNVNIIRCNDALLAMTETPHAMLLSQKDLTTLGSIHYKDNLKFNLTLAHPQYDAEHQQLLNIGISFGRKNYYHVYDMNLHTKKRRILASIPVKQPGYQHSFAITRKYIIIIDQALKLNPLCLLMNLMLGRKSYYENYQWQPEQGNRFLIIEKATGKLVRQLHTDAFFIFHTINAFESGDTIMLDAHIHANPDIVDQLYLDRIDSQPNFERATTCRFSLPLKGGHVTSQIMNQEYWYLSRFNDDCNSKPYRYFYATNATDAHQLMNCLVKHDIETATTHTWQPEQCFVNEPLFVRNPQAQREDDGVVLSLLLDTKAEQSVLVVLDAISFQEIARVTLPFVVPLGLHGNYIARD